MDQGNHVIIDRISLLKVSKLYLASKVTTNSMVTHFIFLFFFFLVGSSNQATVKNIADVIKQKWSQDQVSCVESPVESCWIPYAYFKLATEKMDGIGPG